MQTPFSERLAKESTARSRWASPGWQLLILIPLAVALVFLLLSLKQTDLYARIELQSCASIFVQVSLIGVGVYWIVVRKLTGLSILILIVASAVVGYDNASVSVPQNRKKIVIVHLRSLLGGLPSPNH